MNVGFGNRYSSYGTFLAPYDGGIPYQFEISNEIIFF
jgi:hypothetical protein